MLDFNHNELAVGNHVIYAVMRGQSSAGLRWGRIVKLNPEKKTTSIIAVENYRGGDNTNIMKQGSPCICHQPHNIIVVDPSFIPEHIRVQLDALYAARMGE